MEDAAEAKIVQDVDNWWDEHGPDPVYETIN